MERIHLLASEIFKYSYANYEEHLGINDRFDKLMPKDAMLLESAIREKWSVESVAKKLEVPLDTAKHLITATHEALAIVDAENPAESFRRAVEQSIHYALEEGLHSQNAVERLVTQICYRAADLGMLLEREGHSLSQYSRHLRKEKDVSYYEGYFDEPFQDNEDA
jgi:hypothetical protein